MTGTLLLLFALVALAPGIGLGTRLGLFGAGDASSVVPDAASSTASLPGGTLADIPAEELLPDLFPELPADTAAAAAAVTGNPVVIPDLPGPAAAPLLERELIEAAASAQEIASIPGTAGPESPSDNPLLTWTGHPEYVASGSSRGWRGATAGIGSTGGSSGLPSGSPGVAPGTDVLTNAPGAGAGVSAPGAKNRDGSEGNDESPGNGPSLPEQVPDFVPDLTGGVGQPAGETGNGGGNQPTNNFSAPGSTLPGDQTGDQNVVQVPEPGTLMLFALGLLGCCAARARRSRT